MKSIGKLGCSIILLLLFIVACLGILALTFFAAWLHTYRVFTEQTPVAKVTISEQKEDENGRYTEVTIQEVKGISPTNAIFNPNSRDQSELISPQTFKVYGDTVEIGGPVVKFKDFLTLLNFKTVYQIAFLQSKYSNPNEQKLADENNVTQLHYLNGGYETWAEVQRDITNGTIRGEMLKLFIDYLPQLNTRGLFVDPRKPMEAVLCVTEEGFLFCDKEL